MAEVTALAPWFGAARMIAQHVGEELAGCRWVGVPFAGGMTELLYIEAPTIVVSDLHRHVVNLACCVANDESRRWLINELKAVPFHPDVLATAQKWCQQNEPRWREMSRDGEAALYYFISAWMGRSGKSGTATEFTGGLPVRWNANGGDSCKRFRSAARGLVGWRDVLRRCNFLTIPVADFLAKVKDEDGHGLYLDPPFPDAGEEYRHRFTPENHRAMAADLAAYKRTRVVCRFYDHPLIRELYPEGQWTWRRLKGRKQSNAEAPEVLILNGPSRVSAELFGE
jgi:DNA adenine methylase